MAIVDTSRVHLLQVLLQVAVNFKTKTDESLVWHGFHSTIIANDRLITSQVAPIL